MKKAEARKQDIINCAARLFREQGYPNTSITDIGKAVGVSSAALYYHFASKEDILEQVIVYGLNVVINRIRSILLSEGDIREKIKDALLAQIKTNIELTDFFITHMQEMRNLTGVHLEQVKSKTNEFYALWFDVMEEGVQAGIYVSNQNLKLYLLFSQGALRELMYWRYLELDPFLLKKTPQEIIDVFFEYRRSGLNM